MPEPAAQPEKMIFSQSEADHMLQLLSLIYALDDAIANQSQLRRPEGFIQPIIDIRKAFGEDLQRIAAKGVERANPPAPKK